MNFLIFMKKYKIIYIFKFLGWGFGVGVVVFNLSALKLPVRVVLSRVEWCRLRRFFKRRAKREVT